MKFHQFLQKRAQPGPDYTAPLDQQTKTVSAAKVVAEDFAAQPVGSGGQLLAILAFHGTVTPPAGHPLGSSPLTGYWIRDGSERSPYLIQFPEAMTRNPSWIGWSSGTNTPHCIIICSTDHTLSPMALRFEVFRVLDAKGNVISNTPGFATPSLEFTFTHACRNDLGGSPNVGFADRFGRAAGVCFSDFPYRVDKNAGANPWLSVVVASRAFLYFDWEYDLWDGNPATLATSGTPAGFYDLRTACQNGLSTFLQDQFAYPTPPLHQSQFNTASSDIGCLRWEPNPNYDPVTNPLSPPFQVWSYQFSINAGTAPAGAPRQTVSTSSVHSTWDAIDITTQVITGFGLQQRNDVSQGGPGTRDILMAVYDEVTRHWAWCISPTFVASNAFLYRFDNTVTTQLLPVGTSRVDPGHLYLQENVNSRSYGIKVYVDGVAVYDDLPNGLEAWERYDEEAWPSFGGWFRKTLPADTQTWRDLFYVAGGRFADLPGHRPLSATGRQGDVQRMAPEAWLDLTGDFRLFLATRGHLDATEVSYITGPLSDFTFSPPSATRLVQIRSDGQGRLWVASLQITPIPT